MGVRCQSLLAEPSEVLEPARYLLEEDVAAVTDGPDYVE